MTLWKWSKTAAPNATVDSTINWAEGQAPSSVNDSARAMMAAAAKYRDDISGSIVTTGSSSAYAIATNQVFGSLANLDRMVVAFTPHASNAINPTINIDGTGAVPIRSAPGVSVGAAVLVQGTPYVGTYYNATQEFILLGFYGNPFNIPVGGLLPYTGSTAPNSNFVLPFGQAISRTAYATYFALVGTTFGPGDGVTTFNVLDMRDRAIFGLGNMGGADAGRITIAGGNVDGTVIGNVFGQENRTLTPAQLPVITPTFTGTSASPGTLYSTNSNIAGSGVGGLQSALVAGGSSLSWSSGSFNVPMPNFTPAGTISPFGAGSSHPTLPPGIVLPFILRII